MRVKGQGHRELETVHIGKENRKREDQVSSLMHKYTKYYGDDKENKKQTEKIREGLYSCNDNRG